MTYKQEYIEKLTRLIIKLDKTDINRANYLRTIRIKMKKLHGKYFVPERFMDSKIISLKLSCPEIFN